jgi:hypothetical protein
VAARFQAAIAAKDDVAQRLGQELAAARQQVRHGPCVFLHHSSAASSSSGSDASRDLRHQLRQLGASVHKLLSPPNDL